MRSVLKRQTRIYYAIMCEALGIAMVLNVRFACFAAFPLVTQV
jgi:hypothetical protein